MSFFKKAKKGFKSASSGIDHGLRSLTKPFDPLAHQIDLTFRPVEPVFKPVEKAVDTLASGSEKVARLALKPENLVVEGQIAQTVGDVLIPIGGATGQPEIVALGLGLKAGGKQVSQIGKTGVQIQKLTTPTPDKPTGPTLQDILDTLKDIEGFHDGTAHLDLNDSNVQELDIHDQTVSSGVLGTISQISNLSSQVSELTKNLTKEEEIIEKEEGVIAEAVDVINELSDRLDEATSSKTFAELLRLAKNVESLDKMDFINRNWSSLGPLPDAQLFKVFDALQLTR